MSTNSNIIIQVPDSFINTTHLFMPTALPFPESQWDSHGEYRDSDKSQPVKITKPFLGIYCHWDGYPDTVGKALVTKFDTFEKAFNLIIGGDCSVITEDQVLRYATRPAEEWKSIQPKQLDEIKKFTEANYVYVFKNDHWYLYTDNPLFYVANLLLMLPKDVLSLNDYIRGYYDGVEDGDTFSRFK